jgi:phosphatidate cytidylyltransferase
MLLRIATALVLIPVVVALVWWGPPEVLAAAAALVALGALWEFFSLGERVGMLGFRKWTMVCTAGIFFSQYAAGLLTTHRLSGGTLFIHGPEALAQFTIDIILLVFVFGTVAIGLATRRPLQDVLPAIAISSAGLLFVALPFSYLVRLNETVVYLGDNGPFPNPLPSGRQLVLFTLFLIWAGDVLAYFVGKSLGRMPMAPALSPKKTWEGAIANFVASLLVAVFFARWMQVDTMTMLLIAGLANIAGQAGDLIESAYKRGAVVKDSGTILPGHGGVLDRVDSLILAAPVVWLAWNFLLGR